MPAGKNVIDLQGLIGSIEGSQSVVTHESRGEMKRLQSAFRRRPPALLPAKALCSDSGGLAEPAGRAGASPFAPRRETP
jgi:hypothetical protein